MSPSSSIQKTNMLETENYESKQENEKFFFWFPVLKCLEAVTDGDKTFDRN